MNALSLGYVARHAALIVLGLIALLPLAWLLSGATGLRDGTGPSLHHFQSLLTTEPFARWMVNALFVASAQTTLAVLLSSLGGFALWAYRFPGRRVLIGVIAATMLVPAQVVLPGLFLTVVRLGWLDSFAAVVLPGVVSAFGVFLYATSYRHIPASMLDAARLDGCPEWRLWWSVALPNVRPTTAALTLLGFLAAWNNLLWPSAVLVGEARHTLPIGLSNMAAQIAYEANPGPLMAATLLSILPVAGLFFLCQREFVSGLGGATK